MIKSRRDILTSGIAAGLSNLFPSLSNAGTSIFVPPSTMPKIPIVPTGILGYGQIKTNKSARDAFFASNSKVLSGGTFFVSASRGNDQQGNGTQSAPFATIDKAVRRTIGPSLVCVEGGVYDVSALLLRNTDVSQSKGPVAKYVMAAPGYAASDVIFRLLGADDVSVATWTQTSGSSSVWQTPITQGKLPYKISRNDQFDMYNFPARLPFKTSFSALSSVAYGFYYDKSGKMLYVALAGANVDNCKSILKAYFLQPNGFSRVYIQNSTLGFEQCTFDGIGIQAVSSAVASGSTFQAQYWASHCQFLFAPNTGLSATGALGVSESCRIHGNDGDNILYTGPAAGFKSLGVEVNNFGTFAGDTQSGVQTVPNANVSSAHGGCDVGRFGATGGFCFGPCIRDIGATGYTDTTWNIGCDVYSASDGIGYSFLTADNNSTRHAWIDTCRSRTDPVADLQCAQTGSAAYARTRYFQAKTPRTVTTGGAIVEQYARASPG